MSEWKMSRGMPKTIDGLHTRLRIIYGKATLCIWDEKHISSKRGYEWANVSGEYTIDIQDYLPMCVSCHRRFDVTDNFRSFRAKAMIGTKIAAKKVGQYKGDSLLAVFDSITEAQNVTGISNTSIGNNITGLSKSAGGFTWKSL